jgi:hypothetical protein
MEMIIGGCVILSVFAVLLSFSALGASNEIREDAIELLEQVARTLEGQSK